MIETELDLCSSPVQGHSAWGQFNLVGRVRPCDGYVSLSKDYVRFII